MEKVLIHEMEITIPLHVSPGERWCPQTVDRTTFMKAIQALNKHHTGQETIAIDAKVPESLVNARHLFGAVHTMKVKVKLYSDGSIDPEFIK